MKTIKVEGVTDSGHQVFEIKEDYIPINPRARITPIRFIKGGDGCWYCISHAKSKYRRNYPVVGRYNRSLRMSRYVFYMHNGFIDQDKYVMHMCDNPECINPNHLGIGTPKQNTLDMIIKGRQKVGESLPWSKLSEEQVINIFYDYRGSTTVSKEYGVSKKTVLNIRNGKTWKHLMLTELDETERATGGFGSTGCRRKGD